MRQLLQPQHHEAAEIESCLDRWELKASRYGKEIDADVVMRADLETYLSENCLVKTDRASMLASLEVRVPLLDELLLYRILALPADKKIPGGQLKALLMPVARRLLPAEVWDRPKHGFNVPLDTQLATSWRDAVEAVLDWGESNVDLFNYKYLRQLHAINLKEGGIGQELWSPVVFLGWFMARKRQPQSSAYPGPASPFSEAVARS
jgi:asparagine synthase (glutamine-hydrolysing)